MQQLATTRDQIMISSADIAAKAPFAPIAIIGGVLVGEAMQLFRMARMTGDDAVGPRRLGGC
jgi:hypothetical protein